MDGHRTRPGGHPRRCTFAFSLLAWWSSWVGSIVKTWVPPPRGGIRIGFGMDVADDGFRATPCDRVAAACASFASTGTARTMTSLPCRNISCWSWSLLTCCRPLTKRRRRATSSSTLATNRLPGSITGGSPPANMVWAPRRLLAQSAAARDGSLAKARPVRWHLRLLARRLYSRRVAIARCTTASSASPKAPFVPPFSAAPHWHMCCGPSRSSTATRWHEWSSMPASTQRRCTSSARLTGIVPPPRTMRASCRQHVVRPRARPRDADEAHERLPLEANAQRFFARFATYQVKPSFEDVQSVMLNHAGVDSLHPC